VKQKQEKIADILKVSNKKAVWQIIKKN